MPAEVANTNVPSGSLEGATLFLCNDQERIEALDKAFDYRGDVTLDLANGEKVEGFLFNRDAATAQAELFIKGSDEPRVIPYADIVLSLKRLRFSGSGVQIKDGLGSYAMRRDINWKTKRDDGTSYEVRVTYFGSRFKFQFKEKGEDRWDYDRLPGVEDLEMFLDTIQRRYQRRQATLKELEEAERLLAAAKG
jgi:hypothetical protein